MRSGRGAVLLLAGLATVACSGGRDLAGQWVVEKLLAPEAGAPAAPPPGAPPG